MLKIMLLLFVVTFGHAQKGATYKKPTSSVFDFTYEDPLTSETNGYSKETTESEILISIPKDTILARRVNSITSCKIGELSNPYCPKALVEANDFWTFEESQVYERENTVVDYEQGNNAEHTSTVRDFMDGFANKSVGTIIDYNNGDSLAYTGYVSDYMEKTANADIQTPNTTCQRSTGSLIRESPSNNWSIYIPAWQGSNGAGFSVTMTKISSTRYKVYYKFRADYKWSASKTRYMNKGETFQETWSYGRDVTGFRIDLKKAVFYGMHPKTLALVGAWDLENMPVCKSCGTNLSSSQLTQSILINLKTRGWNLVTSMGGATLNFELSSNKRSYYYKLQAGTGTPIISSGVFSSSVSNSVSYYDGKWNYSINFMATPEYIKVGQFGNYTKVYSYNNLVCYASIVSCPSGYVDQSNGKCKKDTSYKYYSYGCDSGYTPDNFGFSTYTKTDPNTLTRNDNTLDDAVNSSTAPIGNCRKSVSYDYFDYNCSDGYTPVDTGLTTCSKIDSSTSTNSTTTLEDACNDATPPSGNCYKDIEYKYYSYGCSDGYNTDNYGLSVCPKIDPDRSKNNSLLLDDDCNSVKAPEGNCSRPLNYKYFEYLCDTTPNEFNEIHTPIEAGLTECLKSDTDSINTNTLDLKSNCNNESAPINNCRAKNYSCNQNEINPALVDGNWKCSPYLCDGTMQCGYGTCDGDKRPSTNPEHIQPNAYNPLGAIFNNYCEGESCGLVRNEKLTFCLKEVCPQGLGLIEKDGQCFKKECAPGTYEDNGKCIRSSE